MGATLPPGFLDNSHEPSRRPTLVLLGLDLPTAVRCAIRAKLDSDVPEMFGLHLSGSNALSSLAESLRRRGRGFLGPSLEPGSTSTWSQQEAMTLRGSNIVMEARKKELRASGGTFCDRNDAGYAGTGRRPLAGRGSKDNRTSRVQAALAAGRNVSVEVLPGPGLWARGRFLRDLEALLEGIDGYSGHKGSTGGNVGMGPAVILVRGHTGNRSGGGADIGLGTKAGVVGKITHVNASKLETSEAEAVAATGTRRVKRHLEEAAQYLHDLYVTHGKNMNPLAESSAWQPTVVTESALDKKEATPYVPGSARISTCDTTGNVAKCPQTPGLEMLLAACQMLLNPTRLYPSTEEERLNDRWVSAGPRRLKKTAVTAELLPRAPRMPSYISDLAAACREQLAKVHSVVQVADVLHRVDLTMVPFATALALRELSRHPNWPSVSPRPLFAGCCALEAFSGWIVAAVNAATALSLAGGGGDDSYHNLQAKRDNIPGLDSGSMEINASRLATPRAVASSMPSPEADGSAQLREWKLLHKMKQFLVHDDISVVDDDSPWLPFCKEEESRGPANTVRHCRASQAFDTIMAVALRPFQASRIDR